MRKFALLAIAAACVLAGCQKKETVTYDTATYPMKELMGHVVDFGSQAVWHAQGSYVDATGEHSNVPTTEDGWIAAESGAITVAQTANLLKLPGYRQDDGDWVAFSNALHDRAIDAQKAIQKQDPKAMFETGAALYQVCVDCHAKYVLPNLDNKTGEPIPGGPLDPKVVAERAKKFN
ncbi:MAG: hypothetical protein JWO33_964 [Caulobacteraceae bacterium]|nr:hypothetical protein [Caulobacteraceae bacterium]